MEQSELKSAGRDVGEGAVAEWRRKKTRDNLIAYSQARDTCSLFIWSKSNGVRVLNVADAALAYFLLRTSKNNSVTQLVDTHSTFQRLHEGAE